MKTTDLGKFPLGANNVNADTDLPEGSLRSVINADVDNSGNIIKKAGNVKVYSGSGCHSVFKNYFVEGNKLKYINGQNVVTEVEDVEPNRFLAWTSLFGDLYYSDGQKGYIIGKGEWGVPKPVYSPDLTESEGMGRLDAGTYQVAICYRNDTGEISGSTMPVSITVKQNSAIVCGNIPMDYHVVIYISQPKGTELYLNAEVTFDEFTITQSKESKNILETLHYDVMPGGHIVRFHKGRMYVANDKALWFSREGHFGLNDKSQDWFQFAEKITIVQPVEGGIFVVADKTYFLAGSDPDKMFLLPVSDDKGIAGTGFSIGGKTFGKETDYIVGFWYSTRGAILGLPDGSLEALTEDRYAIKEGLVSGCTTLNETDGFKRVITNMTNHGQDSGIMFTPELIEQEINNGVV